MKLLKNHLLILSILVLSLVSGSKVWSQKLESSKVLVSEEALAVAKGREAKKDSLISILESTTKDYKYIITKYESQISNLNNQIKLMNERFEVLSLSVTLENEVLKDDNKKLKKKNVWKTIVIIGEPLILVTAGILFIR